MTYQPEPGMIVALSGHAYRVLKVEDAPQETDAAFRLDLERLTGKETGQRFGAEVPGRKWFRVLPEHFEVCRVCGELPPCREVRLSRYAGEKMRRMEERMSVPPGACMACGEPISQRQKVHVFPGPNLWNPLGLHSPRFHARRRCRPVAAEYEEAWVQAEPGRERSLLTLKCSGVLTVHGDGSGECHGRNDGSDCPTVYAQHRGAQACYYLSHGCPKGCVRAGHPGIRLRPPGQETLDLGGAS